jgi:hypothetical protein
MYGSISWHKEDLGYSPPPFSPALVITNETYLIDGYVVLYCNVAHGFAFVVGCFHL